MRSLMRGAGALAGLAALLHLGCAKGEPTRDLRAEAREVFGAPGASDPENPLRRGGWALVLESHPGDRTLAIATRRADEISAQIRRSDVRVRSTKAGSAVVLGDYQGIDSAAAREDLIWVRSLTANGRRLFSRVFLAPPPSVTDPGKLPELSLGAARATFGSSAKYTLQVGAYESPDRDEAKRAAEQAALTLRQEGTLAFYHHGPRRSMVTVGIFDDGDLDSSFKPSSLNLIALMQAFPDNLLNGMAVIERRGEVERTQPSQLVNVPR